MQPECCCRLTGMCPGGTNSLTDAKSTEAKSTAMQSIHGNDDMLVLRGKICGLMIGNALPMPPM